MGRAIEDIGEIKLAELQAMTGDRGGKLMLSLQRREGLWVAAFIVPYESPVEHEFVNEDLAPAVEAAVVDFIARHVPQRAPGATRA